MKTIIHSLYSILFMLLLTSTKAEAQKHKTGDLTFPDVTAKDFEPKVYSIDSSAEGIFLIDAGTAWLEGNNKGDFNVHYKVFERVRLLNKKSFDDLGTVSFSLYSTMNYKEELKSFEATTYNIDGDKVIVSKLDKSSLFKTKDEDYDDYKFTFPDIKEGCIVEYKYETSEPFGYSTFPGWWFQGHYPRLLSQYTSEIPAFYDFITFQKGYLKPNVDTVWSAYQNFNIMEENGTGANDFYSFGADTYIHKWIFTNVPPLKEEAYTSTLNNYRQSLQYQLSAIKYPNQRPTFYMKGWMDMVDRLNKDEDFGQQLGQSNNWLSDDIKTACGNETDILQRAKKIYEYVRDNYTCTDYNAKYLSQNLKQTAKLKKGNVADINMLLIAMLRVDNFNSVPVFISTRDHGKPVDEYPIMQKFNYLIAKLMLDDKDILMDASVPLLGFGKLDEDCYNGNGRSIASPPVVVPIYADSVSEGRMTTVFLSNEDDASVSGHISTTLGDLPSLEMRRIMQKTNPGEYFKDLRKSFSMDVTISNESIDSLKQLDDPVAINYDIAFKPEEDIIYFNPMLDEPLAENPFAAAERSYPVEMPYRPDRTYILNMEIPKGYVIDELPKPARVSFNDDEGMFEYLIVADAERIQLRCSLKLNKATFEPEDYETLRELYNFIVEKEGEQIVFKKK